MTTKKRPKPDDKEQYSRFIEAANLIDNPDAKEAFEEAMNKIAKTKIKGNQNKFIICFFSLATRYSL